MKKTYEKPMIEFDSFGLSQNIASGCSAISNEAIMECAVDFGGPFTYYTSACSVTPPPGDNKICYDVPAADGRVFTS